jgi:BirA family biotin operon repressor/biotin-[acetyl-CoA-carboxylase] ligase
MSSWHGASVDILQRAWHVPALLVYDVTSSTNDIIKARAEMGAPAGTTAIADLQTNGRGRRDRKWDAPPGTALLMSMLFRPSSHSPADLAGTIPLRVGLAAAHALESVCDVDIWLKWPNDLLARDGRKVGGILCESSMSAAGLSYTVVGIGINVRQTGDELFDDGNNCGVSLRALSDADVSVRDVAEAVIAALLPLATQPAAVLTAQELSSYNARDALAARDVTADGKRIGVAAGISAFGELRVDDGARVRSIHSGTIRVV